MSRGPFISLAEAEANANPGDYIMALPGNRYDSDWQLIICTPDERMKLSSGWITWTRRYENE